MSGTKSDILWSLHHDDQFILYGSNISLYKVDSVKGPQTSLKLSDDTCGTLLTSNTDVNYIRCLAWYPGTVPDNLLAVGQANGKVLLANFGNSSHEIVGKEFAPRHPRQCSYLTWNPEEHHLLAEGLEGARYKNDPCISIWDVNCKADVPQTPERQRQSFSETGSSINKPLVELGPSDTTSSFCWMPNTPKTFVAGMNNKQLRIYDMREPLKAQMSTQTKAVNGLCVDPQSPSQLASFFEGLITVWDIKMFDRPIVTVPEPRHVLKIDWCPTRQGLLTSLIKDSSVIKLYDIRHSTIGADELEPTIIDRNVQPYGPHAVFSFSWHPRHENRIMTITPTGSLKDFVIFERINVSWSANDHLTWTCGKKTLDCTYQGDINNEDISLKMQRRALGEYGLHFEQPWQNIYSVEDDAKLTNLWLWMDSMRSLIEENKQYSKNNFQKFIGVHTILKGVNPDTDPELVSEKIYQIPGAVDIQILTAEIPVYKSERRTRALQLCGWTPEREVLVKKLTNLQNDGEYERAATMALFNLQFKLSLEILSRGAVEAGKTSLNSVAMALSGYTEDRGALWRKMCASLRLQLYDPYLRAMFAFLTGDKEEFDEVLDEDEMAVRDRVAFALTFLNDLQLLDYIEKLTLKLKTLGDLDGILLTGLTPLGIELLRNYVNMTGDVQSAALISVFTSPSEILRDVRVLDWIHSYRELLDKWRLWHQRAEFDNLWYQNDSSSRPAPQVFVSCNFCGKSISCSIPMMAARQRPMMGGYAMGGLSMNKARITSCPGCRKPLPRCALCLSNMGTGAGTNIQTEKDKDRNVKLTPFQDWFTWCQTCRHGGHASHIMQWFKEHSDCPVTGCTCKCMTLDSVGS